MWEMILNIYVTVHVYNDDDDNTTLLFHIAFTIHKAFQTHSLSLSLDLVK